MTFFLCPELRERVISVTGLGRLCSELRERGISVTGLGTRVLGVFMTIYTKEG